MNYNPEPALEAACVALLAAAGLTAGGSRQTDAELSTPRVDVRFELGGELDAMKVSGSELIPTDYAGTFVLSVITDRDTDNAEHAEHRATVRQVMAETTGDAWTAAIGADYRLLSLIYNGTEYDVLDQEKALDASVLTYSVRLRFL
jgi:hypothetical protein